MKLKDITDFIKHVENVGNQPNQKISITVQNQSIDIPLTADSFDNLIPLLEDEKEHLEGTSRSDKYEVITKERLQEISNEYETDPDVDIHGRFMLIEPDRFVAIDCMGGDYYTEILKERTEDSES